MDQLFTNIEAILGILLFATQLGIFAKKLPPKTWLFFSGLCYALGCISFIDFSWHGYVNDFFGGVYCALFLITAIDEYGKTMKLT